MFFAMIFGIVFVIITARNRERMAMIEKGMSPKDFISGKPGVYSILKWALLIIGTGIGVFVGSLLEAFTELSEVTAYFAPILLFGGLGLLIAYLITRNAPENK